MIDPSVLAELEVYAGVVTDLWSSGRERAAVLAEHGLTEETLEALDERVQAEFSAAMELDDNEVPAFVLAYEEALVRARDARLASVTIVPLEVFGAATGALERGPDPQKALAALGLTISDYLKANAHWTPLVSRDPALERVFRDARTRRR